MLMIRPAPRANILGRKARVTAIRPKTLASNGARRAAQRCVGETGAGPAAPAPRFVDRPAAPAPRREALPLLDGPRDARRVGHVEADGVEARRLSPRLERGEVLAAPPRRDDAVPPL